MLRDVLGISLLISVSVAPGTFAGTPAEHAIEQAQASIARSPRVAAGWNDLAVAYARRARETADPEYYTRALEAVSRSLEVESGNLGALEAEIWALLGRHEFAAALDKARDLQRRVPDDVTVYGMLVDAHAELGNYEEAERAAQWMLDLRPGNVAGLARAAYLRELFGDLDGALDLMRSALIRTSPYEVEDRAWLLTHIAHLQRLAGDPEEAARTASHALVLFPGYHYALAQRAEDAADLELWDEAIELRRRHVEAAPHPENYFYLARDLARDGREEEAQTTFRRFESLARAEMDGNDNANRELVLYYADHAARPAEALRIAAREIERRGDVYTRDTYAWALYRNGKIDEAREEAAKILALGTRDPRILEHAGAITRPDVEVADDRRETPGR